MAVLDERRPDASALERGRHAEELQAHVRPGRESLVFGLNLPEHAEQTGRRVRPTPFKDGTEAVRAHRVGRRPMSLGAEPAGNPGDRLAGDDDARILGQRGRHEGSEEVGQDRRALAILGDEHDRSGIRLERGGEDAGTFVNVLRAGSPNAMHWPSSPSSWLALPHQAAECAQFPSCVRNRCNPVLASDWP